MMIQKDPLTPFSIAVTAVFTAFVCVATIIFSVYIPTTEGFFNIGESMVFLSALLFGPYIGAFTGGVGSMFADLLLGYPQYALATLIIKASEGYIVGVLTRKKLRFSSDHWKIFTLILGIIAGSLIASIGTTYYSGFSEIILFFTVYSFLLPAEFWLVLGVIVTLSIAAVGFLTEPEFGWTIFSVIIGGFIMVTGYFIYQFFFIGWLFNIPVVAIAEVPINIGQMTIGAIVAIPIAKIIWRAFPHLKRNSE